MPREYNKYPTLLTPIYFTSPSLHPSKHFCSLLPRYLRRAPLIHSSLFYFRLASQEDHVDRASISPSHLDGLTLISLLVLSPQLPQPVRLRP